MVVMVAAAVVDNRTATNNFDIHQGISNLISKGEG